MGGYYYHIRNISGEILVVTICYHRSRRNRHTIVNCAHFGQGGEACITLACIMAGKVHMETLIANEILYLQDSRRSQIMWSSIGLEFRSPDHVYFHLTALDRAWQHFPGPRTQPDTGATYKSLISTNPFLHKIVDRDPGKGGHGTLEEGICTRKFSVVGC